MGSGCLGGHLSCDPTPEASVFTGHCVHRLDGMRSGLSAAGLAIDLGGGSMYRQSFQDETYFHAAFPGNKRK